MGQLTILFGDAGLGKTHIAIDLLAAITRGGTLPDGDTVRQGNVIVLTAEDDWETTIKPRLVYAGADCAHAFGLPAIAEFHGPERTLFNISFDVDVLAREIKRVNAVCVMIDPLTAFLSGTDTHKQNEVRESLSKINDVARATDSAVLCIMHPNRSTAQTGSPSALYRLAGSLAFGAAARSVMGVAPDASDENEERRLLVHVKCNIGKLPDSIAYTIEGASAETSDSKVVWGEVTSTTANEAFGAAAKPDSPGIIRAKEFLRRALISGDPQPAKVLLEEAEAEGLTSAPYSARPRRWASSVTEAGGRAPSHGSPGTRHRGRLLMAWTLLITSPREIAARKTALSRHSPDTLVVPYFLSCLASMASMEDALPQTRQRTAQTRQHTRQRKVPAYTNDDYI